MINFGESIALSAAALWATASLLYGQVKLTAWSMNFVKNVLATALLLIHLLVVNALSSDRLASPDFDAWKWLSLSGVIGILIGDTCYFRSLQILGARKALLLSTAAPLFAVVFGWVLLNERLSFVVLSGIAATVVGIGMVIGEKKTEDESPGLFPGSLSAGVLLGVGGAVCQALGAVCAKTGMQSCDPLQASFIRLLSAAIGSGLVLVYRQEMTTTVAKTRNRKMLKLLVPAVMMGTWLGIWLSQIAYKALPVSIATTLMSTTPLFSLPLVYFAFGRRISLFAVVGTVVAVFGVGVVVFGSS